MEIIIEYALLDNFIIDAIIILIVYQLKKDVAKVWRVVLAALFGAVTALLLPMLNVAGALLITVKICIGAVMTLIAFRCSTLKMFLLNFFLFMTTTFVLGGIGIAAIYLFFGQVTITSNYIINSPIPVSVIYIFILSWWILLSSAIKYFYRKKNRNQFVFDISLENNGVKISTKAYLDSGNTLIDTTTQKPVIIIGYKTFSKIFKHVALENLLMKNLDKIAISGSHYIEVNAVSNQKSSMLIFPIQKLEISDQKNQLQTKDCVLGLSFAKFQKNFGCDVLLNQNCF